MIHEGDDGLEVGEGDALEVEERMGVGILFEDSSEERGAGRQNQLVGLDLLGAAAESAVQ